MINHSNSHSNQTDELSYLNLFVTTIEEYQRIIEDLPVDFHKDFYDGIEGVEYTAIYVRALLLRKYITRNDNVHIKKIIEKAKIILPDESDELTSIYDNFKDNYEKNYLQILEDGTELNLRETFDDIVYGIFLHADFDRVNRLSKSNELMRFYCLKEFVHSIEVSIMNLHKLLIKNRIKPISKKQDINKAPTIALLDDSKSTKKDISGYWANLYGKDTGYEETIKYLCEDKTTEEIQIMHCSLSFIEHLSAGKTTFKDMKDIVFQETASDWGDFSEARTFLESITNYGIGSTINYNKRQDVAYVKILRNVENPFLIEQLQLVSAECITLIKDSSINQWRVFSFGGAVDPYKYKS